jgi:hypothetical protein
MGERGWRERVEREGGERGKGRWWSRPSRWSAVMEASRTGVERMKKSG